MINAVPLLHDYLERSAQRFPDKVALVCGERRLTYSEIDQGANAVARTLVNRGVQRGDRVIVYADNDPETVIAFWGVLKANAVVSVVSTQTKADKLGYLLRDCRPTALVAEGRAFSAFSGPVRECPSLLAVITTERARDDQLSTLPLAIRWRDASSEPTTVPPRRTAIDVDLAAIIYTSGSTGDPKGVMLTHRNMLTAAASVSGYLGMVDDDVVIGVLPLSFDYGLYQMIMSFSVGARLVLKRSFAYPAEVLNAIAAERVTGFPGVPTLFAMLAENKELALYDFSSVRFVTSTAAALEDKHIEMLRRAFPKARLFSMYGLTECKRVSYLPPEDLEKKPGSVGIPIPNTEVWVVDGSGQRLGPGRVGELVVRGATVMRGYWEKPEQTAKKLRPGPLPGELVLYTGDYARLDEDGYLYFVGRMDDIIKSGGEKVAPKEVERALVSIPGVKEAAVIGVSDALLGQAVKAFVALERGATLTEADVIVECRKRLESFMVPKLVKLVDALPKTPNGKITKAGLS